jgi:asparagine synthase (glutamine-hydrolysing)
MESGDSFLGRGWVFNVDRPDAPAPDMLGAAQYLTFGHCLGGRTLFKGVHRVRGELPNLDDQSRTASLLTNAEELAALFTAACRSLAGETNIVSLSGGLDSRSVVGGLKGVDYRLASFLRPSAAGDVAVGRQIAAAVGKPYDVVPVGSPTSENIERLLQLTSGDNCAVMAFILPFLDHLRGHYGAGLTYFTGDGGDKALPLLTTGKKPKDERELARFLFSRAIVYPEKACEITGISRGELLESVIEVLQSYPESLERKFAKFIISERVPGFIASGEERNRKFFKHAAPFFEERFFRAALTVPDHQKKRHALYREFLRALSPELVRIPYANTGTAITSLSFRTRARVREAVCLVVNPAEIKARLKRRHTGLPVEIMDAPGLNLQGFRAAPSAYSRDPNAGWWAYTLAWNYRRCIPVT